MVDAAASEPNAQRSPEDTSAPDTFPTVAEVAERLKANEDTVRRLILNEPGVLIICFPRKGRRVYRTVRVPEDVSASRLFPPWRIKLQRALATKERSWI